MSFSPSVFFLSPPPFSTLVVAFHAQSKNPLFSTARIRQPATRLAADVDGVGEESVGVGVVQVLGSRETLHTAVAVGAVVGSALDLGQVGRLVQGGGGLVLSVASTGQSRQSREVQRAVDHVGLRRQGVGEDTAGARGVDVRAVEVGGTAGGAAALGDDPAEDGGDGAARGGRAGLEVLGYLGSRAR